MCNNNGRKKILITQLIFIIFNIIIVNIMIKSLKTINSKVTLYFITQMWTCETVLFTH